MVVLELTSHELLEALEDETSEHHQRLTARGWPGFFDVVWLDYCGSLASGAGRKRQVSSSAHLRTCSTAMEREACAR